MTQPANRQAADRPPFNPRTRRQVHPAQALRALPAALALLGGGALVMMMLGSGAKLSPQQLQQRAARHLESGAAAAAAIDYRRLLQQAPANASYREGLRTAVSLSSDVAPP